MQQITGTIRQETEKAIQIETATANIWIPKRGIVDIGVSSNICCLENDLTYFIQPWVRIDSRGHGF